MPRTQEIKNFFNEIAKKRDAWKDKNRYYYEYIEGHLLPFLIPPTRNVLEIGCGTGDLLARLKLIKGVGIDISEKLVEIAREKYQSKNLEFKAAEVEELKGSFDFVVLSDLVGYLEDVEKTFKSIHGVVHPRSRVVITQYSQLWEPVLELGSKLGLRMPFLPQNWLSAEDIENLLYLSGFEVIKKGRKLLFPKYIPLFSSFLNKFLVNFFPFSRLSLVNFLVARPLPQFFTSSPIVGKHRVSIIVPARNEAGMIKKNVEELPDLGLATEIIFIEGHSQDDTLEKIQEVIASYKGPKVIRFAVQDGTGKGDAVRKGFDMATGDILMIYDADMTMLPTELEKFYNALVSGRGEFINGSRLVYPMEKQSMRTLNYIGNKFFSFMFSWLLGQKIKDTLCGTKVLWKKDYEDIKAGRAFFGDFDPFGDFDLLFGAAKLNLKIVDLPVHYRERVYGTTNISRWKHGWLLLKMVLFAMKKIKFI